MENGNDGRVYVIDAPPRRARGDETAALAGGAYVLGLVSVVMGVINMFARWGLADRIDSVEVDQTRQEARMDRMMELVNANMRSINETRETALEIKANDRRQDAIIAEIQRQRRET